MKKFFFVIIGLIIILITFAILTKNYIVKQAIIKGIKQKTGLIATIKKTNVSLKNASIKIEDLQVDNPKNFSKRKLIVMPEIFVDFYLKKLLKNDIHLQKAKINLEQVFVEKNKNGEINIDSIKTKKNTKETSEVNKKHTEKEKTDKDYKLQIDELHLIAGKIVYSEIKDSGEKKRVLKLNLDKKFKNITSLQQLKSILINQVVAPLAINELKNLNIENVENELKENKSDLKKKLENLEDNAKQMMKGLKF